MSTVPFAEADSFSPKQHAEDLLAPPPAILGYDIGRVILAEPTDREGGLFSADNYMEATFVSGAVETIAKLGRHPKVERSVLISKCGPVIQARTMEVLKAKGFFNVTGINPDIDVFFCRERSQKAGIAAPLGITHFVDDRAEILETLDSVNTRIHFAPPTPADAIYDGQLLQARNWDEVYRLVEQSLA